MLRFPVSLVHTCALQEDSACRCIAPPQMRLPNPKLRLVLLVSIGIFTGGCAALRPPDYADTLAFEPEPARTSTYEDDEGLVAGLLDSFLESRQYDREVRDLQESGYSEKEARQRAHEREYFRNNP
jgi:hypothetical protein